MLSQFLKKLVALHLLTKKKALYPEYRKTRDEMQEIVKAQKNVELFFAEEKDSKQVEQIR